MTTILAIETSCDETGVGIARLDTDGTVTLLADEVASSVDEHVRFGGVVYLEVRTDNEAAIALYRSAGFEQIGLRRRYYRVSGADAYTMRREAL